MSQPQPKKGTNIGYALSMGSQLGFLIAFPLVICVLIGVMIDKKLNTFPWFLLLMVLVGIGLTVVDVYKVIIPFLEKRSVNINNKK
ncbi:MAG TPA: AtpZ/AtpI family protein [Candidatus Pacearchaeota archaeon]|nr:AtpZ/AtpI family protein [Candidatus Pacearchaeota archaeon]HPR79808.1 AtpZ/AtpI family protein [Candidatus Pacearchaeota archaeon]